MRVERRYPHPIEKVWRAVTTPEHLGAWFPSPVEIDLRPGGAMRFAAFEGDDGATGTVEEVDAPRRLTFTWGTDRLTFELEPDGDGTTFALTHAFDDRYGAASFATGWEMCLAGLRSVLADEPLPAPDRGVARHEELVHEFGLDEPEVTESDGRWTVRYERQLTCPAEVAWDLWFGQRPGHRRAAPGARRRRAADAVHGAGPRDRHDDRGRAAPRAGVRRRRRTGGPGDHVRVELADGTGHGARITLTVTGTDPAERDAAAEQWGTGAVGHLAAWPPSGRRARPASPRWRARRDPGPLR